MNAGDLNHRFDIERPVGLDPANTTTIEAGVWGAIRSLRSYESLRWNIPASEGHRVITIRYREDLRASDQLVETGTDRSFQIMGYDDPNGGLEQLDVLVVEQL